MTPGNISGQDDDVRTARDRAADAMTDALIREAVGLAAVGLLLLLLDPQVRMWLRGAARRVAWLARDGAAAAQDTAVAKLRADISEYEHRAAASGGGCGCD